LAQGQVHARALGRARQRAPADRHPSRTFPVDRRRADLARPDPLVLALGVPDVRGLGHDRNRRLSTSMQGYRIKPGSIGKAAPFNEVRIDPGSGEILVRGRNVFAGYLNQPRKPPETIDADGWLHTGDVGSVDDEGYLRITDRMKDIIITAGGKNVTPSEWENELKFSPYVTDAVVIGDKRPYLTALVMIDQEKR